MTPTEPHVSEPWRRPAAHAFFAYAASQASDYARAITPVLGGENQPGEFVQQARRLKVWALEVMAAAVLAERASGRSWQQVAAMFGYDVEFVRGRWEPVERAWLEGRPAEIDGIVVGQLVPPPTDADARKMAEHLDEWCDRRGTQPGNPSMRLYPDGR